MLGVGGEEEAVNEFPDGWRGGGVEVSMRWNIVVSNGRIMDVFSFPIILMMAYPSLNIPLELSKHVVRASLALAVSF